MKKQGLTAGYISSFCMELYLVMQAGIPLAEGVEILQEGEQDKGLHQVLGAVATTLYQGYPLYQALGQTEAFPQYMVDMIEVGEQTGRLDQGLKALSAYYNRQEQLSQSLRRAVLYPTVLLSVLLIVMGVLVMEVMPMFSDVYTQLGATMTGVGAAFLQLGMALKANWVVALVVLIGLIVAVGAWAVQGQKSGQRVLLSKKLATDVAMSKLASVLSMALQSGLDVDMAMKLAEQLTQHPELKGKIQRCRVEMEQGQSLSAMAIKEGLFPSLYCRMIGVGAKTGTMDQVMEDIAQRSDTQTQDAIDRHIASVEPTLVVAMSVLVGLVLMSVMLPLASIMSSLG